MTTSSKPSSLGFGRLEDEADHVVGYDLIARA